MSYTFYLTIINKGLEYYTMVSINRLEALRKNDKSYGHEEYESLKRDNDKQIQSYKDNAITYLLQAHPEMFKQALEFDDWRGSQRFLNNNQYAAIIFSKENKQMMRRLSARSLKPFYHPKAEELVSKEAPLQR